MAIKMTTLTLVWIIVNLISAFLITRVGPRSVRPFALALVFLVGSWWPVKGEDQDTLWIRQSLVTQCKRKGDCWKYLINRSDGYYVYRRPYYGSHWGWGRWSWGERTYYRPYRTYYDYDRYDRDRDGYYGRCRPTVIATGHEAHSRDEAKRQGEQAWMEEVRGKWGARYMDPRSARDLSYECYRSSTGNRESERLVQGAAGFLEQCRIEAVPCRARREYADAEPEDRRNVQEDDEEVGRDRGLYRKFLQWRRERRERRR